MTISIHALRGEGDVLLDLPAFVPRHFNPRPPWGGRPAAFKIKVPLELFISIHALRGEGDRGRMELSTDAQNFNPRPPWGGRRAAV